MKFSTGMIALACCVASAVSAPVSNEQHLVQRQDLTGDVTGIVGDALATAGDITSQAGVDAVGSVLTDVGNTLKGENGKAAPATAAPATAAPATAAPATAAPATAAPANAAPANAAPAK